MKTSPAILALVLVLASGCGGDGGGSGGGLLAGSTSTSPVVVSQAQNVPTAAAASEAVDTATQAVTHVILDPFTGGEASDAPHTFLAPATFEFTSHVEFEIDLDSAGRSSSDRFPNVSGVLLVTVDGLLAGTWMAGEASYAVQVEVGTDVVHVDPDSGIETLIPAGSTWSCSVAVTWDITDAQNWLVVATTTKAVSIEGLVVTDGDVVTTVGITGGREIVTAIAKIEGEVARERAITGSFTITIDDGTTVTTVVIEYDDDGLILVTIGDEQFGPFTRQEFREFVQDNLRV